MQLGIFHEKVIVRNQTIWQGICIEILNLLAKSMNFTYHIVEPADRKWGNIDENGQWTGMVRMVKDGAADFAAGKFTIGEARDTVIDFTKPFWQEDSVMVMKLPEPDNSTFFLTPFQWPIWLSIFALLPFTAFFLGLTVKWSRKLCTLRSFTRAFSLIVSSLLQQGRKDIPKAIPSRLIINSCWLFSIIILALYTGNLTAYIAIPKQTPPISTLAELSQQSIYRYGVMDGSALHLLFQGSAYGVYKHMMTNSIGERDNRVSSHSAGVDRVRAEKYIYIGETSGVIKQVYSDCTLAIGKEKFFPSSFGFVIPENSSLQTYFDERILQMTENGLIRKWFKKYYPKDVCSLLRNSRDVPTSAKLHHFQVCDKSIKYCEKVTLPCVDGEKYAIQEIYGGYATCVGGELKCNLCPDHKQYYNYRQKKCDSDPRSWAADCKGLFPKRVYNTSTICDLEKPCIKNRKYADQFVCQGYHLCVGDDDYVKESCDLNEYFDYEKRECVPKNIGKCCSSKGLTSTSIDNLTDSPDDIVTSKPTEKSKVKKSAMEDLIIIAVATSSGVVTIIIVTICIVVCKSNNKKTKTKYMTKTIASRTPSQITNRKTIRTPTNYTQDHQRAPYYYYEDSNSSHHNDYM
ncbi:DgyrCDS619 [Dimorphilus gyrociliatus]|uniref:DgyrCDS619 n=1 Tax=Dimorphilus gyrociliatus TaxID=2664684 RepID=A0A7I8V801_9ANNE|nr:DgyrCDS619 [Dimorphilus gyrociliatus]